MAKPFKNPSSNICKNSLTLTRSSQPQSTIQPPHQLRHPRSTLPDRGYQYRNLRRKTEKNPFFILCPRGGPKVKIAILTTIPTTPEPRSHLPQIQHGTHTTPTPTPPPTATTSPDKGKLQKSFSAPNHQNPTTTKSPKSHQTQPNDLR